MRKVLILFFGASALFISAQQKQINESLKKELDQIMKLDQKYRMLFTSNTTVEEKNQVMKDLNIDEEELKKKSWQLVEEQDSINLHKVEHIFSVYGYPGKTLVGEPTNKAAWFVIQHSNKIAKYLPLIKDAGKKNELPFLLVAMMEDRFLMSENKEQIYGTQGTSVTIRNKDGKDEFINFIWPIQDLKNLDKRRKEAGYVTTVEEDGRSMFGKDFKYEHYSLQQAIELKNKNIKK